MSLIDAGTPETWPADIRTRVDELVERCLAVPTNDGVPSHELRLEGIDTAHEEEIAFRDLLGERPVAFFHATRLLPHEVQAIRDEGLVVVELEHRSRRLDRVVEFYGDELGVERLEALRHVYPLTDAQQRKSRLGLLWGVLPLDAFRFEGDGLSPFLENWGGETFYWGGHDAPGPASTIAELTSRATPYIVEVAMLARDLNVWRSLWKVFAAQVAGWDDPWDENYTQRSIPPDRVISFIGSEDPRWPYR